MIQMLEAASKLKVSELICNTNLMELTEQSLVEEGIRMVSEAAAMHDLIFTKYLVLDEYKDLVPEGLGGKQRIVMSYTLKKPWEHLVMKGI